MLAIGTDIVSLERIERGYNRFGTLYVRRILSEAEACHLPQGPGAVPFLAGRWAAKEACAKALGTGFANGIGPATIQIFNTGQGAPAIELAGPALAQFRALGATRALVSISHERLYAVAFVVLE